MPLYRLIPWGSIILIAISCKNDSKPVKEKSNWEKQKELDSVSKIEANKFSKNAGAIINWADTIQYTYELQKLLTGRLISFTGQIKDVLQKDNGEFILKVAGSSDYEVNSVAEIIVDSSMFLDLWPKMLPKDKYQDCCLIFSVSKVESIFPQLSADGYCAEQNDGTPEEMSPTFDFDVSSIKIKGKLFTCFLFKQLPDEK